MYPCAVWVWAMCILLFVQFSAIFLLSLHGMTNKRTDGHKHNITCMVRPFESDQTEKEREKHFRILYCMIEKPSSNRYANSELNKLKHTDRFDSKTCSTSSLTHDHLQTNWAGEMKKRRKRAQTVKIFKRKNEFHRQGEKEREKARDGEEKQRRMKKNV